MRFNRYQLLTMLGAASIALTAGCASQGTMPDQTQAAQAAVVEDTSTPATPVTAAEVVPVVEAKKEPEAAPSAGSVASVLKKMDKNPRTLFWREKNSYSYHVGGVVDAEYKPGQGLVVKSEQDKSVVCEFNEAGTPVNPNLKPGEPDKCSELMFTLDTELGD